MSRPKSYYAMLAFMRLDRIIRAQGLYPTVVSEMLVLGHIIIDKGKATYETATHRAIVSRWGSIKIESLDKEETK